MKRLARPIRIISILLPSLLLVAAVIYLLKVPSSEMMGIVGALMVLTVTAIWLHARRIAGDKQRWVQFVDENSGLFQQTALRSGMTYEPWQPSRSSVQFAQWGVGQLSGRVGDHRFVVTLETGSKKKNPTTAEMIADAYVAIRCVFNHHLLLTEPVSLKRDPERYSGKDEAFSKCFYGKSKGQFPDQVKKALVDFGKDVAALAIDRTQLFVIPKERRVGSAADLEIWLRCTARLAMILETSSLGDLSSGHRQSSPSA